MVSAMVTLGVIILLCIIGTLTSAMITLKSTVVQADQALREERKLCMKIADERHTALQARQKTEDALGDAITEKNSALEERDNAREDLSQCRTSHAAVFARLQKSDQAYRDLNTKYQEFLPTIVAVRQQYEDAVKVLKAKVEELNHIAKQSQVSITAEQVEMIADLVAQRINKKDWVN